MTEMQKITEEWNDVSFEENAANTSAGVDYKPIAGRAARAVPGAGG